MSSNLTRQVGLWSSITGIALGLAYMAALILNILVKGGFPLVEPYESVIHAVLLVSAPVLVSVWAAIYIFTPGERQVLSLVSLALIAAFAALGSVNRYVALTVVRQSIASGTTDGLAWFLPYGWPSVMSAIEMLAWGIFLGLACIALAPVFFKETGRTPLAWTLLVTGSLCLLAALGQVMDTPFLKLLGVLAWGPGLTLILLLLAGWFRQTHLSSPP